VAEYPIRFPGSMRPADGLPPTIHTGRIDLPDGAWRLDLRWSPAHRGGRGLYLLDVRTDRGVLAVSAFPFVLSPSLLAPFRSRGLVPRGDLAVRTSARPPLDPGAADLGSTVTAAFVYP
jgi:hypothetical protein